MSFDRKLAINTLPPGRFFVGSSGVEPFTGALVDPLRGFRLNLHVKYDGNDRFSLRKEARNLEHRMKDSSIVLGLRIVFISKMQIFRETSEPVEESECDFI